ncbi:MAG: undecaprenyldiphospho-muramoylpentapeptide beta-N-acetylglucosaminyltransferase [Synechococcales bacterium]|nr:undecaprenyldiphospho-muramoylpentapeptide beta-N-acetylglucosaminyltransferase [Synechococcales bacterium]
MSGSSPRLLIAASGTGGHVFPAVAIAEQLKDYEVEWLGVPDRLEVQLVGNHYRLHTIRVAGFQGKPGLNTLKTLGKLIKSIWQVRRILQQGQFSGVFTTGGYIAAPAILAARSLGLPVILHEANALPGKVTRFFAPWCSEVAIGFAAAAQHLKGKGLMTGTPVRGQFLQESSPLWDLQIPEAVPLIVIVGGSQGAVAVNRLIRQCAPAWVEKGIWMVHLTGEADPEQGSFQHPHYVERPFYNNMASLLLRASLAISRAGAGTLTELAMTQTPSILIPYPFAAEDHQAYNAKVFVEAGAAEMFRQEQLLPETLQTLVLDLLNSPDRDRMAKQAASLAVPDSAHQVAQLIREQLSNSQ